MADILIDTKQRGERRKILSQKSGRQRFPHRVEPWNIAGLTWHANLPWEPHFVRTDNAMGGSRSVLVVRVASGLPHCIGGRRSQKSSEQRPRGGF